MTTDREKRADAIAAMVAIAALVTALVFRSLPAAIIFATVMAEDCFTRWLKFKRGDNE